MMSSIRKPASQWVAGVEGGGQASPEDRVIVLTPSPQPSFQSSPEETVALALRAGPI